MGEIMDMAMEFYGQLFLMVPTQQLVLGVLVVLLLFSYFAVPFLGWALLILGVAWGYGLSLPVFYGLAGFLALCVVKPLRAHLLTRWLFYIVKIANVFPKVSETERIALEAGKTWLDKDLFSGKPDVSKMLKEPYAKLAADEQAFLDGPVEELCAMVDDWEVSRKREFPEKVWSFIKKHRLFGMIVPKEYGGLDLSPLAHSAIVAKLSSRCSALGITVMVPNSLGPAELLVHYGTQEQKDYYLPRLARGEEIPCFALTEPRAGSDAGAMQAEGVVIRKRNGDLVLKLNFDKRWITLSGISTVVGLAFQLKDPQNYLGKGTSPGITCALIPRETKGLMIDTRHDPLGVPFYNCPIKGRNIEVPVSTIIGGPENAGRGWFMLMESLSVGRGISLPANATGGSKLVLRVASSFAKVRQQFGLSIGQFEGVEEPLARIGGLTYMLEASRRFMCGHLATGGKPGVVSAIMKYHYTESFRQIINDGMDIMGGSGISAGPRNLLVNPYMATPIGITVEGANILTRTMIVFGQGALRCHPYAYAEVKAANENNLPAFDQAFWGHVLHVISNLVRSISLSLTRGVLSFASFFTVVSPYKRRLVWASASFALLADICMGVYGGKLKFKEKITGRLADILSFMYFAVAVIRRFENDGRPKEDRAYVLWCLDYCFDQIQQAFDGIYANMDGFFKVVVGFWSRLNRIGVAPSDKLGHEVAVLMQQPSKQRDRMTEGMYIPSDPNEALGRWENAFRRMWEADPILRRVKVAMRKGILKKQSMATLVDDALSKSVIKKEEAELLKSLDDIRLDAIQVDAFTQKQYLGQS